jgi:phosphate transport system protein
VSHLTISSNIERIADLGTNIAEEIIFMNDGEILRHT